MTRALLLSTYVKFVNLFPEIRDDIQSVLEADSNLRSADAELQQRAAEYLNLSRIVSTDVLVSSVQRPANSIWTGLVYILRLLIFSGNRTRRDAAIPGARVLNFGQVEEEAVAWGRRGSAD